MTKYKCHIYVNDALRVNVLPAIPRCGDTLRMDETTFVTVTEVVWCLDEDVGIDRFRINIRTKMAEDTDNDS